MTDDYTPYYVAIMILLAVLCSVVVGLTMAVRENTRQRRVVRRPRVDVDPAQWWRN